MKHSYALFKRFRLGLAGLMLWSLAAVPVLHAGGAKGPLEKIIRAIESAEGKITDFGEFLKKLPIKEISFVNPPKGFSGLSITATIQFNDQALKIRLNFLKVPEAPEGRLLSLILETPSGWKLTTMFPKLKSDLFDKLSLPEAQLVYSNYSYKDPDLGVEVKKGLNLVAGLDLAGPFALFDSFVKNKAKFPDALVFEAEKLKFVGFLAPNITESSFTAIIPFHIGVDFTKIKQIPKSVSDVFQKITTGDFTAKLTPPPNAAMEMEAGLEITIGKQPAPFKPRLGVQVTLTKLAASARLEEKIELKWLALSGIGVQVEWDDGLAAEAAILGIPFTGIGLRGTFYLGKEGEKRGAIDLAAMARVQTGAKFADFLFQGKGQNLYISDFINFLVTKLRAKPLPSGAIPTIILNKLSMYVATSNVVLANKEYKAGLEVDADVKIANVDAGLKFKVDTEGKEIAGEGHLSPIKTKWIELTGVGTKGSYGAAGEQITFEGPEMKLLISGTNPETSNLMVHGTLKLPTIDVLQKVDLHLSSRGAEGDFETKVANLFVVDMKFKLDTKKPEDFLIDLSFTKGKEDFAKLIKQGIAQAAGPLNAQIEKDKQEIARLQTKKHNCECILDPTKILSSACKDEGYDKHAVKCAKDTLRNIEREIKKAKLALEQFSQTLLNAITTLVDALTTVELKSASGQISGVELAQGKLPKVSMELYIKPLNKTITLEDLQFDFKNPANSIKSIGEQIVNIFK